MDDQTRRSVTWMKQHSVEDLATLLKIFNGGSEPNFSLEELARRQPAIRSAVCPHQPVSHSSGLQSLPLRDRDAALYPPAGIKRSVADYVHDPARLLHDEAQCHCGNVSCHLAGVRHAFIRSRPSAERRAIRRFSSNWKSGSRRSPASRQSLCSPTPVRKANTRACS